MLSDSRLNHLFVLEQFSQTHLNQPGRHDIHIYPHDDDYCDRKTNTVVY
jgi:hypothetical protein